jgi:hypothetical protein
MTGESSVEISEKSYGIAVTLSIIFGVIGVQHFYIGRFFLGLFDVSLTVGFLYFAVFSEDESLIFIGLFFLLADVIHTLMTTYWLFTGTFKDGTGKLIAYPGQFGR